MSKLQEIEKKIYQLENKLKETCIQKEQLKKQYDKSLNDSIGKLNIVIKSFEYEKKKYLKLNEEQTPKCLSSVSYEDVLIKSIKNSECFKQCIESYKEGSLKNMSINYEVKPRQIKKQIKHLKGQGITYTEVETNNSNQEIREKIENDMKRKDYTKVKEITGGFSYES
jgi:hypothetical protein